MVLAGREWLVSASHAARRSPYARLLLLSGIVAVAWLAGGFGVAHGETAPESGGLADRVLQAEDEAEREGQAVAREVRGAHLSDATAHASSATESLTDTVVPQAAALPASALHETGVTEALDQSRTGATVNRAVEDTTQAVDDTARGAGEVVGGLAHRGNDVVESTDQSLRDGRLMGTVTEGLTDSTRAVQGRIDEAVDTTAPLDLPLLEASETTASDAPETGRSTGDDEGRDTDRERIGARADVHTAVDPPVAWHTAAGEAAEQAPDDDRGERIRLIAGGAHHSAGTDTTGAAAPSFPAPGAAGFLMTRSDHLAPRVQRVALPGDPTLVVRDAADDPSFSPD